MFYRRIHALLPDGNVLADHGLIEHQQVKELLADLQRMARLTRISTT